MAANSGVVGVLRALLTADTAQFDTAMRKASATTEQATTRISGLTREVGKLTPQAERMVRAFGGDRQLNAANNLAAAISRIGGATKLTAAEQARANTQLNAAIEKYKALGIAAPKAVLNAEKSTSTLSGQISKLVSGLGPLGPAIAASFSITAVIAFVRTIAGAADSLVKLHDKTQVSLQGLQRMQIAGDDAGNSIEELTGAISQFQNRLGATKPSTDFTDALKRIGLTTAELKRMAPEEQLMAISDGLRGIEDPAIKANTAVALGGRQMLAVLPTLSRGFDDLRGHVVGMSDDTIRGLDEAGDAWKKLERVALDAMGGIVAKSIDFMFPFKAAVRQEQALLDQLKTQADKARGAVPGLIGPPGLNVPTMDLDEADRIAKELDEKTKELIQHEQELARVMAQAFGLDKVASAKQLLSAIGGMAGMARMDADALKSLNKLIDEAIGAAKRNGQEVPLEWFRILEATRDNVGSLQEYLKTVRELPEAMRAIPEPLPPLSPGGIDTERMRKILEQNAPGSRLHHAAEELGQSVGQKIVEGIGRAFEQVPHFLIASVIHSGNFINGLKAIGIDMADAIVEPLIREFIKKLVAAKIADKIKDVLLGGSSGGGTSKGNPLGALANGLLPIFMNQQSGGEPGGIPGLPGIDKAKSFPPGALGPIAGALVGFGVGNKTGSKTWGSLAGVATGASLGFAFGGPLGALIGGASGLIGGLVGGLTGSGHKANSIRDKDLAQFAGFDTAADKADTANPPGFHGLARLLTKYGKGALFTPFATAHDPGSVRRSFEPIQAFVGSLGRSVKSFQMGGFVPSGVVQPALLHGPEFVIPANQMGSAGAPNHVFITYNINAIDASGVKQFVESPAHLDALGNVIERNTGFIATRIERSRPR